MRIAMIGCGTIGQAFIRHVRAVDATIGVAGVLVREPAKYAGAGCPVVTDLDELLALRPDWIVECAGQAAFASLVPRLLRAGNNVLAISSGALADAALHAEIESAARQGDVQLCIPAGALAGIDALAGARHVGLTAVRYVRTAQPATWVRAGALQEDAARALTAPRTVYEGCAREAARRFPKNANVTATLALAGIGFERTRVQLIADPAATGNTHAIEAEGAFGTLRTSLNTAVIPGTRTSRIVAGSLAHALVSRVARIAI